MPEALGVASTLPDAFECCGLTRTAAVEDTLKVIFELAGQGSSVGTSMIARQLGVKPPTTSAMLKRLVAHGLLDRSDTGRLELTEHGAGHARLLVRRQRLLETFLVEVLHLSWDEVQVEAEALEHALSGRVLEQIDAVLGRPTLDPHGDPIPQERSEHVETWGARLDPEMSPGSRFEVERVRSHDAAALRYLAELGVRPGVTIEVLEWAPFGGPVWVLVEGRRQALGLPLVQLLYGHRLHLQGSP